MSYNKTAVDVRIGFATSNADYNVHPSITITDRLSGKVLIDVEVSAAEFANLLAARNIRAMAEILPPEHYAKVGKEYVINKVNDIPEEFVAYRPGWDEKRQNLKGPSVEMNVWAELHIRGTEWEGFRWSHHNYGWSLIVYKYVEVPFEKIEALAKGER